jgi:putative transcriptional regulator
MTKRNLMNEMNEGFEHLKNAHLDKVTLRTIEVKYRPAPTIDAKTVIAIRERLNLSQSLFANYLRTNLRTLENWEQGRAKPNAQAALLIYLVDRYPDTVEKIAAV